MLISIVVLTEVVMRWFIPSVHLAAQIYINLTRTDDISRQTYTEQMKFHL